MVRRRAGASSVQGQDLAEDVPNTEGFASACLVALNTGFLPFSDFVTSECLVVSQVKWVWRDGSAGRADASTLGW